jgi:hypothetical protein
MKPNQLEQYRKEIEEKKEQFKETYDLIKPYIDFMQKHKLDEPTKNTEEKDKNDKNDKKRKASDKKQEEKKKIDDKTKENNNSKENIEINKNNNINEEEEEKILNEIYMKMLLNELNKDFNDTDDNILKTLNTNKNNYTHYCQTLEKIKEIKEKMEAINKELKEQQPADPKDKKPVKKEITNAQNNLMKELDTLNKDLISIKSSLYYGFIILNFPKNEDDALKLEKYFTGFQLDYQKPKNITEEKLINYNIVNLNLEQKNMNKGSPLVSFLDLYINFKIEPNEVNKRYNNTKYDPTTGKKYTSEELATVNDKKLLERLEKGLPGITEEDLEKMKISYNKDIYDISKLYKKMNNGINCILVDINQQNSENDKNY